MEASPSLLQSMVPDAMLLNIASYLEGNELMQLEIVSKKFHSLHKDLEKDVWKDICHRRWKDWPRYKWENLQKIQPRLVTRSWKQKYLFVEKDYARKCLTWDDLRTNEWYFNFKPHAGGRGTETLQKCSFPERGRMILSDWPHPLYWQLGRHRQQQYMIINEFPPHVIERCKNGEWKIENENVVFVSCPPV